MKLTREIRNYTLENAIRFNGKATAGSVIGKILGVHPELKKDMKTVSQQIRDIIAEVNAMNLDDQKSELKEHAPELLKKEKKEKQALPDLRNATEGKVVTRLPPEPSKYAHLGHAMSFLINYMYAEKYKGKCILKYEDTNPEKCSQEYVDSMEEDIKGYLGIKPVRTIFISDDMAHMYKEAERLIGMDKAYVCFCEQEQMRDYRHEGKACRCRSKSSEKNISEWNEMRSGKYKEGECVLRLKGDMESKNHTMRDPVIFRVCYNEHYRHKKKYCVWPLYDFENSVEDSNYGVTHILRSNEFGSMRGELQNCIKDLLGYKRQEIKEYGRFNIEGAVTKGREIRELIEQGKVTGWDDPSLMTLKALKRRGIVRKTLYELVKQMGVSAAQTNIDWTIISSINRAILDKAAHRYFFIDDPMEVEIKNAPKQELHLNLHPDDKSSKRRFATFTNFYVSKKDIESMENDKIHRLMDCLNFVKKKDMFEFHSTDYDEFKKQGKCIIHWLPADEVTEISIRMPDNTYKKGIAEKNIKDIKIGDVVQFQRFGFCRRDSETEFWFTHR